MLEVDKKFSVIFGFLFVLVLSSFVLADNNELVSDYDPDSTISITGFSLGTGTSHAEIVSSTRYPNNPGTSTYIASSTAGDSFVAGVEDLDSGFDEITLWVYGARSGSNRYISFSLLNGTTSLCSSSVTSTVNWYSCTFSGDTSSLDLDDIRIQFNVIVVGGGIASTSYVYSSYVSTGKEYPSTCPLGYKPDGFNYVQENDGTCFVTSTTTKSENDAWNSCNTLNVGGFSTWWLSEVSDYTDHLDPGEGYGMFSGYSSSIHGNSAGSWYNFNKKLWWQNNIFLDNSYWTQDSYDIGENYFIRTGSGLMISTRDVTSEEYYACVLSPFSTYNSTLDNTISFTLDDLWPDSGFVVPGYEYTGFIIIDNYSHLEDGDYRLYFDGVRNGIGGVIDFGFTGPIESLPVDPLNGLQYMNFSNFVVGAGNPIYVPFSMVPQEGFADGDVGIVVILQGYDNDNDVLLTNSYMDYDEVELDNNPTPVFNVDFFPNPIFTTNFSTFDYYEYSFVASVQYGDPNVSYWVHLPNIVKVTPSIEAFREWFDSSGNRILEVELPYIGSGDPTTHSRIINITKRVVPSYNNNYEAYVYPLNIMSNRTSVYNDVFIDQSGNENVYITNRSFSEFTDPLLTKSGVDIPSDYYFEQNIVSNYNNPFSSSIYISGNQSIDYTFDYPTGFWPEPPFVREQFNQGQLFLENFSGSVAGDYRLYFRIRYPFFLEDSLYFNSYRDLAYNQRQFFIENETFGDYLGYFTYSDGEELPRDSTGYQYIDINDWNPTFSSSGIPFGFVLNENYRLGTSNYGGGLNLTGLVFDFMMQHKTQPFVKYNFIDAWDVDLDPDSYAEINIFNLDPPEPLVAESLHDFTLITNLFYMEEEFENYYACFESEDITIYGAGNSIDCVVIPPVEDPFIFIPSHTRIVELQMKADNPPSGFVSYSLIVRIRDKDFNDTGFSELFSFSVTYGSVSYDYSGEVPPMFPQPPEGQEWLWAVLIIVGISISIAIGTRNKGDSMLSTAIFMILSVTVLFLLFTYIGWIPIWVVISLLILIIGFVSYILRKKVTG